MTIGTERRPTRIAADTWGAFAHRRVVPGAAGLVLACFEHSLYLKLATPVLVCVGDERIGRGPLNVCVSPHDWRLLSSCLAGDAVRVTADAVTIGERAVLPLNEGSRWRPRSIRADHRPAIAIELLVRNALARAPADGLFRPALGESTRSPSSPLGRIASPAIDAFRSWLGCSPSNGKVTPPPAVIANLIGLGPGLTPSGDDLLAGSLIMLTTLRMDKHRAALWEYIAPKLDAGTSEISAAHLLAAAQGEGHEAIHDIVAAVLAAPDRMPAALDHIDTLGHTSGWDAAAGLLLVLAATCSGQRAAAAASSAA
jgi:hypothetical protein